MNTDRFIICAMVLLLSACSTANAAESSDALQATTHFYLLQAEALGDRPEVIAAIAAFKAQAFILDAYFDASTLSEYTSDELNQIRAGSGGPKLLAYLSIGEAEDYRPYWNEAWDVRHDGKPDAGAPSWLVAQNRKFKGNYVVKYWDREWQALLMGSPNAPLDRIIEQGFDGVYLDIIDAFEFFEDGADNAINPETGQTYRRDMVDFVKAIAAYSRAKKPGFFVVPQNGAQLVDHDDYLQTISGIGQEDLYFDGNRKLKPSVVEPLVAALKKVAAAGKAVLVTMYPTGKPKKRQAIEAAKAGGFSVYIGPRALHRIGETAE